MSRSGVPLTLFSESPAPQQRRVSPRQREQIAPDRIDSGNRRRGSSIGNILSGFLGSSPAQRGGGRLQGYVPRH